MTGDIGTIVEHHLATNEYPEGYKVECFAGNGETSAVVSVAATGNEPRYDACPTAAPCRIISLGEYDFSEKRLEDSMGILPATWLAEKEGVFTKALNI